MIRATRAHLDDCAEFLELRQCAADSALVEAEGLKRRYDFTPHHGAAFLEVLHDRPLSLRLLGFDLFHFAGHDEADRFPLAGILAANAERGLRFLTAEGHTQLDHETQPRG